MRAIPRSPGRSPSIRNAGHVALPLGPARPIAQPSPLGGECDLVYVFPNSFCHSPSLDFLLSVRASGGAPPFCDPSLGNSTIHEAWTRSGHGAHARLIRPFWQDAGGLPLGGLRMAGPRTAGAAVDRRRQHLTARLSGADQRRWVSEVDRIKNPRPVGNWADRILKEMHYVS